jgi:mRNA-degrading endonuclease RelE of RelBE toxin-antitoxin system
MYSVGYTDKSKKQLESMSKELRFEFVLRFRQLAYNPFIGKLSDTVYHTHIKYKWVAVWSVNKKAKTVIITYIGSRENAPY